MKPTDKLKRVDSSSPGFRRENEDYRLFEQEQNTDSHLTRRQYEKDKTTQTGERDSRTLFYSNPFLRTGARY